jgi:hypothetical protein
MSSWRMRDNGKFSLGWGDRVTIKKYAWVNEDIVNYQFILGKEG